MRKSLNFGTDNIFYVPEDKTLTIFDIYNWRVIELDISRIRCYLNTGHEPFVRDKIRDSTQLTFEKDKDREKVLAEVEEAIEEFMVGFQRRAFPTLASQDADEITRDLFYPQSIVFWVRISDVSLESFFDEDYGELGDLHSFNDEVIIPINTAIYLNCLETLEQAFPIEKESGTYPFALGFSEEGTVEIQELSPFELLPLIDDYCGAYGSSGRGIMINYTHHTTVSEVNLASVPLYKSGPRHYVTLYFSLSTNVDKDITLRLTEKQFRESVSKLEGVGFQVVKTEGANYVMRRGDDVVHLYGSAMSKEALTGSMYLSPFLLVAANDTDMDPERRSELLSLFLQLFPTRRKQ
jgi:hypothetical protein